METQVVSGRVPTDMKRNVDEKLSRMGYTANEVIALTWAYINDHDEIPWMEKPDHTEKVEAFDRLALVSASIPAKTKLATMTPTELKKELANRD